MKIFCFVFSFYILLLSLAPCGEMTAIGELQNKEISQQTQIQTDTQTDENGDDCSPFCICSCCHFSTAYQFKTFSVTNKVTVSAMFRAENLYQNPYAKEYKTSVWQPPKFNLIG
jgi:hypothetical protein